MMTNQHAMKTILIVEDDSSIGPMLLQLVTDELSYSGILATDSNAALETLATIQPILFIFNYWLPQMNGIELFDKLHAMKGLEDVPAIMISAALPEKELRERGIIGIEKPFDIDRVLQTVENLVSAQTN